MWDVEVVGWMSENLDQVEAVDGSVFDLDASKQEDRPGAVPGDVNTETDSLSQLLFVAC